GRSAPSVKRPAALKLEVLEDRTVPSFASAVAYGADTSAQAVATGDFNNDGILDLAVANSGSSSVSVLPGSSGGTFGTATNHTTIDGAGFGSGPRALAVGDLDKDGYLDIATANSDSISLLMRNEDGTFQAPSNTPFDNFHPTSVAIGDLDGNGTLDLV